MEFRTGDLVIRPVTEADLAEVARRWKLGKGEITSAEARQAIDWMQQNHQQNRVGRLVHSCFAVFECGNDRIIGWCGLDGRSGTSVNLFYMIDAPYRRRGYATRCAQMMLSYGFELMELARIHGECAVDNLASQRILEKMSMKQVPGDPGSLHYILTRDDYQPEI